MEGKKATQNHVWKKIVMILVNKGYVIKNPIYYSNHESTLPVISYERHKYKLALHSESEEQHEEQLRIAAAVIMSGESVLKEYDGLHSVEELFETFPIVKEYYSKLI